MFVPGFPSIDCIFVFERHQASVLYQYVESSTVLLILVDKVFNGLKAAEIEDPQFYLLKSRGVLDFWMLFNVPNNLNHSKKDTYW